MMRRLLCFLHISSLLCRTTVCSLAIGGFSFVFLADILAFLPNIVKLRLSYIQIGIKRTLAVWSKSFAFVFCFR